MLIFNIVKKIHIFFTRLHHQTKQASHNNADKVRHNGKKYRQGELGTLNAGKVNGGDVKGGVGSSVRYARAARHVVIDAKIGKQLGQYGNRATPREWLHKQ